MGALVIVVGVAPLFLVRDPRGAEPAETRTSGLFSFAAKAPVLLSAVFAFAIFDAATLSLLVRGGHGMTGQVLRLDHGLVI